MKILNIYLLSRLTYENVQGLLVSYIPNNLLIHTDKVVNHFVLKNSSFNYAKQK